MKKYIFSILALTTLLACDKDNNNEINNEMNGTWHLLSVSCECPYTVFEEGDHIWNFDLSNNMVSVTNNEDDPLQILESGEYEVTFTDTTITIEMVTYDYYFENENLYLSDHPEVDGPLMLFAKDE